MGATLRLALTWLGAPFLTRSAPSHVYTGLPGPLEAP